ncbi:MAG: T9SS type A sorting domain-containing protein [Muribaculaceae bacterium]|nr:T9SS type A sorting domain-containing protein [Muribaculaceae bacterium]
MKRLMISMAAMAALAVPSFAEETPMKISEPVRQNVSVKFNEDKIIGTETLPGGATVQICQREDGVLYKRFPEMGRNRLNPVVKRAESTGANFSEDFESWDGQDKSWLPEGWTRNRVQLQNVANGWMMSMPTMFGEIPSKCPAVFLSKETIEDWIITPAVNVTLGMNLDFDYLPLGPYFFDENYMTPDGLEFTELHTVATLKVMVSTDGGNTWSEVWDAASQFKNYKKFWDLYYSVVPTSVRLSLSKYMGKNINVAFVAQGTFESGTFVDNVAIGLPDLNLSYTLPTGSLYYGLTYYDAEPPTTIAVNHINRPVTFTNTSSNSGATYSWAYTDDRGEQTSDEQKKLTVTYAPNYDDNETGVALYPMPTLRGESSAANPTEYTRNGLFQPGGKGVHAVNFTDGTTEDVDFGLTILDAKTEGTATVTDWVTPLFGYDVNSSDYYWTSYSFGYQAGPNDLVRLVRYGDLFSNTADPMVIHGVRTQAYGRVSRNAKFTAEIYPLSAAWVIADEPIAKAICTGEDITIIDRSATNYILSLNFKFDEPVVMSTAVCGNYVVAIGGFNDPENVEYFSPELSAYDSPTRLGLGWVCKEMTYNGDQLPWSWSNVSNYTNVLQSFYIMLDATYPWLETETTEVDLSGGATAGVKFDSFFDGADLTVEGLPESITAQVTGRYNETVLNLTNNSATAGTANVTVKGPGVAKTLVVNYGSSGIDGVSVGTATGERQIYTLTGRRVVADESTLDAGVYIVRNADGTATKFIKR